MPRRKPKDRPHATMLMRIPLDVKQWLEEQAEHAFTSQNAEAIRAIRVAMKQQASERDAS